MRKPRVCIVSPALASANNGNWHTAARWQRFLAGIAQVRIAAAWDDGPDDALIALHARRSAESVRRYHEADAARPLALVLTGTDLYRDLQTDASAQHSVQCASHLVVLQPLALQRLGRDARAKARCIVQSASRVLRHDQPRHWTAFAAVGHLRAEKDPLVLMQAARLLAGRPGWRIAHIGQALDPSLAEEARRTMADVPQYRWLGGLAPGAARRWIARSHALVHMSRMEGGANVVIEAVRSHTPVLASRIEGNVGLLGEAYTGYFAAGDAAALAALMERAIDDAGFLARLQADGLALEERFAPEREAQAVRTLLHDLLHGRAGAPLPQCPAPPSTASPP